MDFYLWLGDVLTDYTFSNNRRVVRRRSCEGLETLIRRCMGSCGCKPHLGLNYHHFANIALAIITLVPFGLFTSCTASTSPNPLGSEAITSLQLEAPAVIQAGAPAQVVITTNTTLSDRAVRLLLMEAYGTTALEEKLSNGAATFTLEPALTQAAGQMRLLAQVDAMSVAGAILIEPGAPVEPILTLVGPRSLTADGEHWAMLVAVPQDRYDNPVADNTQVLVRTLHPAKDELGITNYESRITNHESRGGPQGAQHANGDLETLTATTEHLLAWMRIYARTKAGRMTMAANAGSAHSQERMVLAVPGVPLPFSLAADPIHLTADGQQLLTVRTDTLVDRFGNQLMDGVNVTFFVEDANGTTRSLPTQLIHGQAAVKVQAPVEVGPVTVRAFVLDAESSPLTLTFTSGLAVESFAVTVTVTAETLILRAGPLVGQLGQYIPDGSTVTFQLYCGCDENRSFPLDMTGEQNSGFHTEQSIAAMGNALTVDPLTVIAQSDMGFATGYLRRYGLVPGTYIITATVGVGRGEATLVLAE